MTTESSTNETWNETWTTELREVAPRPDDVQRARMERRLLAGLEARALSRETTKVDGAEAPKAAERRRWVPVVVVAAASLVGGVWIAERVGRDAGTVDAGTGDAGGELAVAGPSSGGPSVPGVEAGELVAAGGIDTRFEVFDVALVVGAGASVRLTEASRESVVVAQSAGRVAYAFHPVVRGEEHLRIETGIARVEVVGTEFTVEVGEGTVRVVVTEGVVRVTPDAGEAQSVRAGESLEVTASEATGSEVAGSDVVGPEAAGSGSRPTEAVVSEASPLARVRPREASARSERGVSTSTEPASFESSLAAARASLDAGRHAEARAALAALRDGAGPLAGRLEAGSLLAESFEATGANEDALSAYARVVSLGGHRSEAAAAHFARARLYERVLHRADSARDEYELIVRDFGAAPLAAQARESACRLGATLCEGR